MIKDTAVLIDCNIYHGLKTTCENLEKIGAFKDAPLGIGILLVLGILLWLFKLLWKFIAWIVKEKKLKKVKRFKKNEEYSKILGTILEICILPKRYNWTNKSGTPE